jgi:type II secretory pathway pseudopilin PulG
VRLSSGTKKIRPLLIDGPEKLSRSATRSNPELLHDRQFSDGGLEMSKSQRARRSPTKGHAGFTLTKIAILIGVIAVVSALVFLTGTKSSSAQKKYKATREIVVDKQTGQRRMPTQEEIDEVVSNLSQLANRPENLPSTQGASGAEVVDLQGGYGGVMLARPGDNGSLETRCVFTFDEGTEFLGLVEEITAE